MKKLQQILDLQTALEKLVLDVSNEVGEMIEQDTQDEHEDTFKWLNQLVDGGEEMIALLVGLKEDYNNGHEWLTDEMR